MIRRALSYITIFVTCIGLDRLTKAWSLRVFDQPRVFNQFLSCDVVINRGISWSMFDGDSSSVFILISCAILAIIMLFAVYTYYRMRVDHVVVPHIIVLAGAVSNMIDRVEYGGVIDFIAVRCGQYHFPIFNIADVCIVLGIFALMIYEK